METKDDLGEWVGLCKIDNVAKPRIVVKCNCVVEKVSAHDWEIWGKIYLVGK